MTDAINDAWALLRSESVIWAMESGALNGLAVALARGHAPTAARQAPAPGGSTAVIAIMGPLVRRGGMLARLFGMTSYDDVKAQVGAAVADASVSAICLFVDSPGGVAGGCEECADIIHRASRTKPTVAFVDGVMASAALWLGSGAGTITASPSSEVGSLGVVTVHADVSRALDQAGVTATVLVSKVSPYKWETSSLAPLSTEARAQVQAELDFIADKFVAAVSRGRRVSVGKVKSDFGKGRMMFAQKAKDAGLIDAVGSIDAVLASTPASRRADRLAQLRAPATERERRLDARQRRLELLRRA